MTTSLSCCDYFVPCHPGFAHLKFSDLSGGAQAKTVVLTIIGACGLGIGSLATYRLCLQRFSAPVVPAPLPQQSPDNLFTRVQVQEAAQSPSSNTARNIIAGLRDSGLIPPSPLPLPATAAPNGPLMIRTPSVQLPGSEGLSAAPLSPTMGVPPLVLDTQRVIQPSGRQ